MDQLKDFLKLAIQYRFWIAFGISLLLPGIAYVLGAGPVQQQAAAATGAIDQAAKGVKPYTQGKPINRQYAEIVTSKTEDLNKDVDESWKKLYDRQAPLLTWPDIVHDKFTAWGRQWPKDTDASAVQIAIINYVETYPKFVTEVYKSFEPFDPVEGTGVVAAPPESILLRPATFSESSPPGLGKVWAAQERLWIQRTLLDVVAKVNKGATTWDSAIIKKVDSMEIGNMLAQDQRSLAKGDTLEEAPDITDPAAPPPVEAAPVSSTASSMTASYAGGGGAPGTAAQSTESVFYIKSESPAIKILPVQMTVQIDQDHIQDYLVALENSPMTIQVMDFEMYKPLTRVTKPEKGTQMAFGMGMGMGMGMMGGSSASSYYNAPQMTGYGGSMSAAEMMNNSRMYNGGGASAGPAREVRKGVDASGKTREKDAAEQLKKAKAAKGMSLHDPYFNIVEVKMYGQARFFNPPPPPPAATPSQSETPADAAAATATTPAAPGETKPEPAKDEGEADKKTEPAKAEGEAEKKAEPAKAEGEADKKAEPAKAEGEADKKAEPAKAEGEAETKKAEPAKDAAEKKAEPAKDDDGAMPKK